MARGGERRRSTRGPSVERRARKGRSRRAQHSRPTTRGMAPAVTLLERRGGTHARRPFPRTRYRVPGTQVTRYRQGLQVGPEGYGRRHSLGNSESPPTQWRRRDSDGRTVHADGPTRPKHSDILSSQRNAHHVCRARNSSPRRCFMPRGRRDSSRHDNGPAATVALVATPPGCREVQGGHLAAIREVVGVSCEIHRLRVVVLRLALFVCCAVDVLHRRLPGDQVADPLREVRAVRGDGVVSVVL